MITLSDNVRVGDAGNAWTVEEGNGAEWRPVVSSAIRADILRALEQRGVNRLGLLRWEISVPLNHAGYAPPRGGGIPGTFRTSDG